MSDTTHELKQFKKPLNDDPQASFTLPSYLYTDADVYEIEKEKIFYRTWQYVAPIQCLNEPGDYVTVQICDQNIFVMRGGDGELRAFYNVCQHRAHELLPPGRGNVNSVIVCPYHAWAFTREGALRGAPRASQRPGFNKDDFSLKQVKMDVFLNLVFVNLDPDAQALNDIAADLAADIEQRVPFLDRLSVPIDQAFGETRIKAGWKVVVDNYVECYHCDHAHRDFANLISMDSYEHDTFGIWARQLGKDIRRDNTAYPIEEDAPYMQSAFWFLWPNTTFNILPGAEELNVSAVRPIGLEDTDFNGHTLSVTGEFNQKRSEYTADILVPEDISLCESVQRGLKSRGYSQGPIIADDARTGRGEHALHHFHRLVQDALS